MSKNMEKTTVQGCILGCLFTLLLIVNAFFACVVFSVPVLVTLAFSSSANRKFADFIGELWCTLPGAVFELLYGTKIVITGDKVKNNERSLIIMNHRCRLDWMFFWMVHLRTGRLSKEKIIMRGDLKRLPALGWAMQNLMHLFLHRRWELDESYLNRIFDYFISLDYPIQLQLFPEGTNMCRAARERSNAFADKNSLPRLEYCLYPRVKGFNYIVQSLRGNIINTVQDVTIAYPKNLCYSEVDLLKGHFPREIHVYFKNYEVKDLPSDSHALDKWCMDRWVEKEERLKKFYEKGSFVGEPVLYEESQLKYKFIMCAVLVFWGVIMWSVGCAIWWYPVVRWYCVTIVIYYIFATSYGGVDGLQLYRHGYN